MNYRKLNLYLGWFVFLIATIVFFMTIEDTVSLWDCGEYITAAYKLEVGHPPGAPFFMVLGRLFSFFAAPENVSVWINRLSALSSSLTILFMFWTITLFARKIALRNKDILTRGDEFAVLGAGLIGSLAYTFTDSFWFSAVEGEVYAMSSLFTAVIFWAGLKWDEEMALRKSKLDTVANPDRWLLLIMFLLGLAIGVHLLGILVVPAICFLIYFRYADKVSAPYFILVGVLSVFILGFIQSAVIPGSIYLASLFEVSFRNSFGLPFYTGTIFFFLLLIVGCVVLLRVSRKRNIPILYNSVLGLILLLIGYSTFAVIVIRSNANPPLDENDPENLVTLRAYLNREQYGSAPILFGPYWNSNPSPRDENGNLSPFYLRRFVVIDNDKDVKAFRDEAKANAYLKEHGADEVVEKYYEANSRIRIGGDQHFEQTTLFPRMYYSMEPTKVSGYKYWSGYDPSVDKGTEIGRDGNRLPTFGENLRYFFNYQVNFMYVRYFMWNFAGRQNDIQNHDGDQMRGNWISGFPMVDNQRLGNQGEYAPYFTSDNKSNNKFFYLPLILGLIGMIFHFYRKPKDAFVIGLAFLFTGLAIVVYLNQKPFEPRERDYAYAGSFYFFAMWIGIGVYALYDAFRSFAKKEWTGFAIIGGLMLLLGLIVDASSDTSTGMPITLSWLIMIAIAGIALGLMSGLRKALQKDTQGAVIATLLGLFVPVILGMQGWDDHDRSNKFSARDLAYNYLEPCAKNAILFTNGDNDTFPLWYLQEVEGKRTDVRVCNLSLMQTDWYTEQMMMKAYDSDPLPIKFEEQQILMYAGTTDNVIFIDLVNLIGSGASQGVIKEAINLRIQNNMTAMKSKTAQFEAQMTGLVNGITVKQPQARARFDLLKKALVSSSFADAADNVLAKYTAGLEILNGVRGGQYAMSEELQRQFSQAILSYEDGWDSVDIDDAMAFVRNDDHFVPADYGRFQFFPSRTFTMPVDKEQVLKSGILPEGTTAADLKSSITFSYKPRYEGENVPNGLSREETMMMDVLANNDWKRGIYFSSAGGSSVSKALYYAGYVKQDGLTYVLSPLNDPNERFDMKKMYRNLMEVYKYEGLNDKEVLTDYYTRRNTSQYRYHYLLLANEYTSRYEKAKQAKTSYPSMIERLRAQGDTARANSMQQELGELTANMEENRKHAVALIDRSLEVMPASTVIEYGEPQNSGRTYGKSGEPVIQDGVMHGYVEIYYRTGETEKAEALGKTIADQLESIIDYYTHSDILFISSSVNNDDLFAALENYFTLTVAAGNPEGNPEGKLAARTQARVSELFQKTFPAILDKIKARALEDGETMRRGSTMGYWAGRYFALKDHLDAIGMEYGLIDRPAAPAQQQNTPQIDLQSLMNAQP